MIEHVFWSVEPAIDGKRPWAWRLRYHPEPTINADGSRTLSLNFPAFTTCEWLEDHERSARDVADVLNRAPLIEAAARDLLKSIDFDNSGLISPETTHAADVLRRLLGESK